MALGLINILVPMSKVSGRFFFGLPDAFIEATRLGAIVDRTNFVAAAYVLFTIEMGIDDAIAFFVSNWTDKEIDHSVCFVVCRRAVESEFANIALLDGAGAAGWSNVLDLLAGAELVGHEESSSSGKRSATGSSRPPGGREGGI